MKITPIARMSRSFDKDERGDAERKRLELFLRLIEGMDIPLERIEDIRSNEAGGMRFRSLKWLDRNIAIRNRDHKDFQRARNLLRLIMKTEWRRQ